MIFLDSKYKVSDFTENNNSSQTFQFPIFSTGVLQAVLQNRTVGKLEGMYIGYIMGQFDCQAKTQKYIVKFMLRL